MVGVTERSPHDIVTDLVDAGYVVKDKAGRRNRYRIQEDLPLQDPISRQRTIGEMLDLLVGTNEHPPRADATGDRRRLNESPRGGADRPRCPPHPRAGVLPPMSVMWSLR
jgi:hypothetical protein